MELDHTPSKDLVKNFLRPKTPIKRVVFNRSRYS